MDSCPDCYAILGIKIKADQKEIKEAFYKLSKEYHPDISNDETSLKKFREVAEAYEVLGNPVKRKEYDDKMGFNTRYIKFPKKNINSVFLI